MNIQKPLVTIGIPTYNRAGAMLRGTIECALGQTYDNIEIIVSDNCSSDNTGEVVTSYKSEKIKYLRQNVNLGSNGNFNALLDAANGDYFLLLHDDDLIDSDLIETCMAAGEYQSTFGLIRTGTRMIDGDGGLLRDQPNTVQDNSAASLYEAWLKRKTPFYLCSTLFNTKALREAGGLKSKNNLFEDGIAIINISQTWPILNVKDSKASFRMHDDQRTHAANVGKWCEDFRQAIDLICGYESGRSDDLYQVAMENFSKTGLMFAKRIEEPVKRCIAMIHVNKHFPYKYWPKDSWKTNIIGLCASIFHPERRKKV